MRYTLFAKLVHDEFGQAQGEWILHSHVLAAHGKTANELVEDGEDLKQVWETLCDDFRIPAERRLGQDTDK
ncbi:DUF3046 domain-containing protein [Corynebacterium kozikiae]|uniref:DUF3046 domain-containing protein n=1 Tax=Corynebacterium kozikiae TaxID=2968469 RepID=UPI00211B93D9|nr:DUF3046 domain-containing protein [Corynebacterium sp. 76QC2CO]MCQ9342436.1 DUF3046 domain-containing protein [Corynebacterium sp. 76QC2CO]